MDNKSRKALITGIAREHGFDVEMIDLRMNVARIRKGETVLIISFWRGISAEHIKEQMEMFLRGAGCLPPLSTKSSNDLSESKA